jgi:hypothetical protein
MLKINFRLNSMHQKIYCKYFYTYDNYTSTFYSQTIEKNTTYELVGNHFYGKSNMDVTLVKFKSCNLRFPRGVWKFFPNVKLLHIENSQIKSIDRDVPMNNALIEKLVLRGNDIPFLPADFLNDMHKLTVVKLIGNRIQMVDPSIFEPLKRSLMIAQYNDAFYNKYAHGNWDAIHKALLDDYSNSPWKRFFDEKSACEEKNAKLMAEKVVMNDLKRAMNDMKLEDFTIVIGHEFFKVHKLILAARSPVFAKMIENNTQAEELKLFDVSAAVFRVILGFIYNNELPQSSEIDFKHLLVASEKLEIKHLAIFAAEKLISQINPVNALELLTLGDKYGHKKLQNKALAVYKKNARFSSAGK